MNKDPKTKILLFHDVMIMQIILLSILSSSLTSIAAYFHNSSKYTSYDQNGNLKAIRIVILL